MPEQIQTPAEEFPTILDSLPFLVEPETTTESDEETEF